MFYQVDVPDTPIPLKRARVSNSRFYDPQHGAKALYAAYVMNNLQPQLTETLTVPLSVTFHFIFPTAKSWTAKRTKAALGKPHVGKIDIDNLIKFFFDTMNGILWEDDRQIWRVAATKTWGISGNTSVLIGIDDKSNPLPIM